MPICFLTGEQENIDKFSKRLVKVTKQHNEECKRLLTLMGVPYIEVQKMLRVLPMNIITFITTVNVTYWLVNL